MDIVPQVTETVEFFQYFSFLCVFLSKIATALFSSSILFASAMFNLLKIPPSVLVSVVIVCVCVVFFLARVSFGFFFTVSISLFVMTMCFIKSLSTIIIAVLKSLFANYNISVISGHFSID